MNECRQDIREAREAVEEILHHPTFLKSMCLTQLTTDQPGSRPMHEVSATLLESYERQLETTEGILRVRSIRDPVSVSHVTEWFGDPAGSQPLRLRLRHTYKLCVFGYIFPCPKGIPSCRWHGEGILYREENLHRFLGKNVQDLHEKKSEEISKEDISKQDTMRMAQKLWEELCNV